ncbi:MAG: GIY-YIG nuclease family protein [Bacteroidetes bacterium]|nr:GIY-YIG nuclease family protein [Bacteroidota bacterium]
MFYIYILYSQKVDKYYVGQTEDIEGRLISHKTGISKYTSISDDWILVYKESFNTRNEAIRRENEIKKKKSKKYIEWLISESNMD